MAENESTTSAPKAASPAPSTTAAPKAASPAPSSTSAPTSAPAPSGGSSRPQGSSAPPSRGPGGPGGNRGPGGGGGGGRGGPGGRGGGGGYRGGGGGGGGGGRRFFRRRKVDFFSVNKIDDINYKDADSLRQFIGDRGKILPRRHTGLSAQHQRLLKRAIKRARNIALLPFAGPGKPAGSGRPMRPRHDRGDRQGPRTAPVARPATTDQPAAGEKVTTDAATAPAVAPASVEKAAPVATPAPVEKAAPVATPAPVEEAAPVATPAPVEEAAPAEKPAAAPATEKTEESS